jgi:hypothetical protein
MLFRFSAASPVNPKTSRPQPAFGTDPRPTLPPLPTDTEPRRDVFSPGIFGIPDRPITLSLGIPPNDLEPSREWVKELKVGTKITQGSGPHSNQKYIEIIGKSGQSIKFNLENEFRLLQALLDKKNVGVGRTLVELLPNIKASRDRGNYKRDLEKLIANLGYGKKIEERAPQDGHRQKKWVMTE